MMKTINDASKNWATRPTNQEDAELFRDFLTNGKVFVPDIREHTANIARIILLKDSMNFDGFEEIESSGLFTKKSTDAVIVQIDDSISESITTGIRVADCGGITFQYNDSLFGVIHAGWKGVVAGIIQKVSYILKDTIGDAGFSSTSFVISPMAVSGYEFAVSDFNTLILPYIEEVGLKSEDYFMASGEKGELLLHDLVRDSLLMCGAQNIHSERTNTLSFDNPFPSHRRYSQGVESKTGRLFAGIQHTL